MKESDKEKFAEWVAKMIVFWSISALLYFAVIHNSTVAWWIIGSLCVMKVMDWYKGKEKESENDKNN